MMPQKWISMTAIYAYRSYPNGDTTGLHRFHPSPTAPASSRHLWTLTWPWSGIYPTCPYESWEMLEHAPDCTNPFVSCSRSFQCLNQVWLRCILVRSKRSQVHWGMELVQLLREAESVKVVGTPGNQLAHEHHSARNHSTHFYILHITTQRTSNDIK